MALLTAASFTDGAAQGILWAVALTIDIGGPLLFGAEGWKLVPGHFAERHGLIVIIALGESVVAIGVGSQVGMTAGVITAAVLGIALAAALWWAYFDVVAHVATRRLIAAPEGRVRNSLARDSFSVLHFPMVAGIVLGALGVKKTLLHVADPLDTVPAFALLGGIGLYLLGHVAFRLRNFRTVNKERLLLGVLLFALVPLAVEVPALTALGGVTVLVCGMIAYEAIGFADARDRVRHHLGDTPPSQ